MRRREHKRNFSISEEEKHHDILKSITTTESNSTTTKQTAVDEAVESLSYTPPPPPPPPPQSPKKPMTPKEKIDDAILTVRAFFRWLNHEIEWRMRDILEERFLIPGTAPDSNEIEQRKKKNNSDRPIRLILAKDFPDAVRFFIYYRSLLKRLHAAGENIEFVFPKDPSNPDQSFDALWMACELSEKKLVRVQHFYEQTGYTPREKVEQDRKASVTAEIQQIAAALRNSSVDPKEAVLSIAKLLTQNRLQPIRYAIYQFLIGYKEGVGKDVTEDVRRFQTMVNLDQEQEREQERQKRRSLREKMREQGDRASQAATAAGTDLSEEERERAERELDEKEEREIEQMDKNRAQSWREIFSELVGGSDMLKRAADGDFFNKKVQEGVGSVAKNLRSTIDEINELSKIDDSDIFGKIKEEEQKKVKEEKVKEEKVKEEKVNEEKKSNL